MSENSVPPLSSRLRSCTLGPPGPLGVGSGQANHSPAPALLQQWPDSHPPPMALVFHASASTHGHGEGRIFEARWESCTALASLRTPEGEARCSGFYQIPSTQWQSVQLKQVEEGALPSSLLTGKFTPWGETSEEAGRSVAVPQSSRSGAL